MKKKPNIILISLDTVRADHLSCYGYQKHTTPNIDNLAEDGFLFEKAFSTAAWTPPGHASMLTGLYPSEHKVIHQNFLASEIPTLAEILAANNYVTAGFVNNSQVGQLVGLNKGHQTFVEVWKGAKSKNIISRTLRWMGRKSMEMILINDHGAKFTTRIAIKWLQNVRDNEKPFYLFLHYIDAHNPLNAPFPYRNKFINSKSANNINMGKIRLMADNPLRFYSRNIQLNEKENEYLKGLYDGEIAYLDKKLGEIINYLKKSKIIDNTLIIITADHGEHFGEHGHYSHVASLYQPIIHIPLIFRMPEIFSQGKRILENVQTIDILPTIANIINLDSPIMDSVSGKTLITSEVHFPYHKYIVSEWEGRVPYFILRDLDCDEHDPRVERFRNKIYAIQDEEHKYILSSNGSEELYNLREDPHEINNIIKNSKDKMSWLKLRLEEWKHSVLKKHNKELSYETDEATRKNLEALGYL